VAAFAGDHCAFAAPSRATTVDVTIGEADDVPEKTAVYCCLTSPPPKRSP
jgi:hypothetical protein